MPGDSGATVVTTVCIFSHTGCGCTGHPAFPTPSIGRKMFNGSGAMRGEGVKVCLMDRWNKSVAMPISEPCGAVRPSRFCLKNKQI